MKFSLCLFTLINLFPLSCLAASDPLLGKWKTIDNKTGYSLADVLIQKGSNGTYQAIITQTREIPGTAKIYTCTKCEGEYKNQPIIGMTILSQLKLENAHKNTYNNGQLLDPFTGLRYDTDAQLGHHGKHLRIQGSGNSYHLKQTWIKQ